MATACPARTKVYGELRDALMRGRFIPSATVTLRGLAHALRTSAMPVRAALQQLVAEQALVVRPNRMVMVPRLTAERFNGHNAPTPAETSSKDASVGSRTSGAFDAIV